VNGSESREGARTLSIDEVRARHPRFLEALIADAGITATHRGERGQFRNRADALLQVLRLIGVSDGFLGLALYRAKARLQALGIPVLPRIAHRLAQATDQIAIGDPVLVHPGVYILHGQVVIDGFVEVHSGALIAPFVTIGLLSGSFFGPVVGPNTRVGTGAKILGGVEIGEGASIGANAVVIGDVPAGATVVGAPARPVPSSED
jgi:serine O-acetyltransferase